MEADYAKYFLLESGGNSSQDCKVDKYQLVEKDNKNEAFTLGSGKIEVDLSKIPDEGSSVFLEATTLGGVKAVYELAIKISKEDSELAKEVPSDGLDLSDDNICRTSSDCK